MSSLVQTIDGIQEILGICPCCGEIFRLIEAKFIFPKERARSSSFLELIKFESELEALDQEISEAEREFQVLLDDSRHKLKQDGMQRAYAKLRKIDPIFSGAGVNPHDVKAIFHPVEYIIFHGLNSDERCQSIEFVSREPENNGQEALFRSVDDVIQSGHVHFETLRMIDDGSFEVKRAV
jgi:predicted Holliday junction resolvase-like endonuclease